MGDLRLTVSDTTEFKEGEEVFLFLRKGNDLKASLNVVGLSQGKYTVEDGMIKNKVLGLQISLEEFTSHIMAMVNEEENNQYGSPTDVRLGPEPITEAFPKPEEGMKSPLYDHRIQWAHSEDGVRFQSDGHVLLEHASVPDGIRRDDGETWVYYVNGIPGQHAVFIARLEGEQLVPFERLYLDGEVVGDAVDPDIVALPEGGYRLFYFLGWFTPENRPPPGGAPHPMYSAVSADGVHFEVEQIQLTLDNEGTDPTVVHLPSGRWLMAVSAKEHVVLAATDTGNDFALTEHEFPQGISELAYFPETQVVRLFIFGPQTTVWKSADEGKTWEEIPMVKIPGPDPSVVSDGEDGWIMFYKSFTRDPVREKPKSFPVSPQRE